MTRYFKRYIDSDKEVEISRDKAVEHLGRVYKYPKRILRRLPLNWNIKVGWCYYKKVDTK